MADSTSDSSPQVEKGWSGLKQHIIENKINFGLWLTRCFTIIFTIGYVIPIFGYIFSDFVIIYQYTCAQDLLTYFAVFSFQQSF